MLSCLVRIQCLYHAELIEIEQYQHRASTELYKHFQQNSRQNTENGGGGGAGRGERWKRRW